MHYGEKLGAHPWADLAASKRNKPIDDAGQGDLLLLLLLWPPGKWVILILGEAPVPKRQRSGAVGSAPGCCGQVGAQDTQSSSTQADPAAALQSGKCVYFWDIGFPAGRTATAKVFIGSQ